MLSKKQRKAEMDLQIKQNQEFKEKHRLLTESAEAERVRLRLAKQASDDHKLKQELLARLKVLHDAEEAKRVRIAWRRKRAQVIESE